ncbi:hypothetical protein P7K49_024960 [Saguinus oedipus]|uniref:Uncharacterized protein n=1 Tax=Saguinus oedipus TaxID=9490 RepID=A0ABQ9UFY3_SAGOE|nr:hypothetical protein P7K49_024960 [Saguinus oedipus]
MGFPDTVNHSAPGQHPGRAVHSSFFRSALCRKERQLASQMRAPDTATAQPDDSLGYVEPLYQCRPLPAKRCVRARRKDFEATSKETDLASAKDSVKTKNFWQGAASQVIQGSTAENLCMLVFLYPLLETCMSLPGPGVSHQRGRHSLSKADPGNAEGST